MVVRRAWEDFNRHLRHGRRGEEGLGTRTEGRWGTMTDTGSGEACGKVGLRTITVTWGWECHAHMLTSMHHHSC